MNPTRLFPLLLAALALPALAAENKPELAEPAARGLKICVAADAPAEIRRAAESVLAAVKTQPLLAVFSGDHPPTALADSAALLAGKPEARAFDHLVLVGLPTDPLIAAAWQREARVRPDGGFYIGGFGHLRGDIGYLESDRNPLLHSRFIPRAPYETECVTLTGTTPAGVALAVDAFLKQGLVNGVVARPGWAHPEPNLLQRDPLAPGFAVPEACPARAGEWTRIGFTQASEDEYRGVLEDTGLAPLEIWRAKYYRSGVWDRAGAAAAFGNYSAGLHRRATGNTVWTARFTSAADAKTAAPKIAEAAKLKADGAIWKGNQPPHSTESGSPGPLTLWRAGQWLILSALPTAALPSSAP